MLENDRIGGRETHIFRQLHDYCKSALFLQMSCPVYSLGQSQRLEPKDLIPGAFQDSTALWVVGSLDHYWGCAQSYIKIIRFYESSSYVTLGLVILGLMSVCRSYVILGLMSVGLLSAALMSVGLMSEGLMKQHHLNCYIRKMYIDHTWIYWQGKICRHFRLLIWISFITQFVHPVGEEDQELNWSIVNLASCEYNFIRVHGNLVQHPSNYICVTSNSI